MRAGALPALERYHVVDPRQHGRATFRSAAGRPSRPSRPWAGPHIELRNRLLIAAVEANQPQLDVVCIIDRHVAIARDPVVAAHRHAQRLGNFARIDAQRRGPLAIDIHQQFRLIGPQRRIDIDDARNLRGLASAGLR